LQPGCERNYVSKNCLINHRIIRSFLAAGLLGLFALAMMPKIAVHALVAHHHDVHLRQDLCVADQLNAASFHCTTDNLVVELPFVVPSLLTPSPVRPCFVLHRPIMDAEAPAAAHPLYGLRGPPALLSL